MRNENGKRVRVAPAPARPAEQQVVANRRVARRTSSTDTSASQNSCLTTLEEVKEEVSSSWEGDEHVAVGCRKCGRYALVFRKWLRCLYCRSDNVINFGNFENF